MTAWATKMKERWTLHELRRTSATISSKKGLGSINAIENVLNRRSGLRAGIVAVYNRSILENEKRALLDRWASWLLEAAAQAEAAERAVRLNFVARQKDGRREPLPLRPLALAR
jgi:hypothetical protein